MLNKILEYIDTHPIGKIFKLGQKQAVWKKVTELKTGLKIAIESDGKLEWDEIVGIKSVGRERVYDIEVEGTHNFVGNGIIAHNTEQLRLGYDVSNYNSFTVDSGGDLTIAPSGGDFNVTATTTAVSGNLKVTGGNILNSAGTANIIFSGAPTTTANTLSASNWLVENTANVGQAALMVNQTKAGDLFTASASGATKFAITNSGIVKSDTIGTAKANVDIFELTNRVNAVDMDTTRTSILFNQWYYDATTPAIADAGRLTVGTETDWTSTASTHDAFLSFDTALDGTLAEKMRITSAGNVGIGTTSPSSALEVNGNIELTNLYDNDASNFFDGGCSATTSLTGIDSTGAITCTAITGVPASSIAFSGITSGTNTQAAMLVGTGASLNYTGSGTINASSLIGGTWAIPGTIGSTTPNTGAFTTLTTTGTINSQTISSAANFTGTATIVTSVSSPIFQGISAATTLGNVSYGTTIAGSGLTVSPTAWTATPTISGLITATSGLTANGALTANSTFTLGDNGDTGSINTSDWDISTTGVMTGIGAITMDGLLTGSLGTTITGAVVSLNASSNFATNINTGTSNAALTLGGGSGTVAINSSDWDISTTGAMTGIGAITTDGAYTQSGTNGNTFTGDSYFDGGVSAIRIRNNTATRYRSDFNADGAAGTTINAYDDTGAVYLPMIIQSSTFSVYTGTALNANASIAAATNGVVSFFYGHGDLAENYQVSGTILRGGLVSIDNTTAKTTIASSSTHPNLIGVVSTKPGAVMDVDGGFQIGSDTKPVYTNEKVPVGLVGAVPVLVTSQNGSVSNGDAIGISTIPGFGTKMTTAGQIVGKTLEKLDTTSCTTATEVDSIVWPEDDGKNSLKPCFQLPDGTYVGKVMVAVAPTWYDPDVYLTSTGDLKISEAWPNQNLVTITPEVKSYQLTNGQVLINKIGAYAKLVSANIRAGLIESEVIKTNIISPIANTDLIVDLQPDNATASSKLVIKGVDDKEVASIDATGLLTAYGLQLTADATVAGTLYANKIESERLNAIEELLREVETNQALLTEASLWDTNTATDSALIADSLQTTDLYVTGQAAMTSLFVSDNFTTKNINSLTDALQIQSLASAPLEIMAGKIIIDTNGNTKFLGNVEVAGDLKINNIIVATNTPGEPGLTPEVSIAGEITTNATAGTATLPAGLAELKIVNPKLNLNSLIYLTPVSSTQNKVLYVKSKDVGIFTIGFNEAIDTDVEFNWWIIELQQ